MADDETPLANPAHFEDPSAPIVYAEFVMGGGPANPNTIALTFAATFLDHRHNPPQSHTKTVLRLVMPRESMINMAEFIRQITTAPEAGSASPPANTMMN